MFFNVIRYLILSKILSCFSPEWNNPRYLVVSCFLIYSSTSSKIIQKKALHDMEFSMQCRICKKDLFEIKIINIDYYVIKMIKFELLIC